MEGEGDSMRGWALRAAWLIAVVLVLSCVPGPVLADGGPPADQVEFRLTGPGASEPIAAAELRYCLDPACRQTSPYATVVGKPVDGVTCAAGHCRAQVFADAARLELVLHYASGARTSNPFSATTFMAVDVGADGLVVGPDPEGMASWFVSALVLTLAVELLVGWVYVAARGLPRLAAGRVLGTIAVGNLLTVPVVWYVVPMLGIAGGAAYLAAELFAWLFEAGLLLVVNRALVAPRAAVGVSFLMNLLSASAFLLIFAWGTAACTGGECIPLALPF